MAYSNSASERMDELRFRTQQSPRNDSSLLGLVSPPRNGNRGSQPMHSQDGRGGLMRRFTTDSGRVPTIGSIANQRGSQEQEYGPSVRCSIYCIPSPHSIVTTIATTVYYHRHHNTNYCHIILQINSNVSVQNPSANLCISSDIPQSTTCKTPSYSSSSYFSSPSKASTTFYVLPSSPYPPPTSSHLRIFTFSRSNLTIHS